MQMLKTFGMQDCKQRLIPLLVGISLLLNNEPQIEGEQDEIKGVPYREVLGLIIWLQVATRPDFLFAVNFLS